MEVDLPWKDERHITHRSFRIVDLLGQNDYIVDRIFEDCTIYGPAVVVPLDHTVFDQCVLDAPPDALLWEVPEDRQFIVGAIGLIRCTLRRCHLRGLGIAGPKAMINEFMEDFKGSATVNDDALDDSSLEE
jgi:hypothetical protein